MYWVGLGPPVEKKFGGYLPDHKEYPALPKVIRYVAAAM